MVYNRYNYRTLAKRRDTQGRIRKSPKCKATIVLRTYHFIIAQADITKIPQAGQFMNDRIYFSLFWRLRSPRSRSQQHWCLERIHFLIHRLSSSHYNITREKTREISGIYFIKDIISFLGAPPLDLITSQRTHFLITPSGYLVSTCEFQGDISIQYIILSCHYGVTTH